MATLSQDTLKAVSLCNVKQVREDGVQGVEYISGTMDYDEFFLRFLIPNRPCVFSPHVTRNWRAVQEWVKEDGKPNFDFLTQRFGHAVVPVADCKRVEYSAQPKSDMQLAEYLQYWANLSKGVGPANSSCLYLKDWHFKKSFPDYEAYETPIYFTSDWMNEYWDVKPDETSDDYRFVYMGPKGSWTPFHADVFRSYSWSANVCGRKRWLLFPPGQEANLRDTRGNLVYDVTSSELQDQKKYPHYEKVCKPFEVIQGPGEVIFVPSGWHHQVFNIEDTISINHNWLNGCNVDITWAFLQQELASVKDSISDCVDMEGWDLQCQLIMKANTGIDYPEFLQLLWTVAAPRLHQLQTFRELQSGKCPGSQHDKTSTTDETTHNSRKLRDCKTVDESGNCGRNGRPSQAAEQQEPPVTESSIRQPFSSHNPPELRTLAGNTVSSSAYLTDSRTGNSSQVNSHQPFPQKIMDNTGKQKSVPSSTQNTTELPNSLTARKWHMVFDLCRIKEILASLVEDRDFCQIERDSLCKNPQQFLKEIVCATKDLV